jgi:hypothetical protein
MDVWMCDSVDGCNVGWLIGYLCDSVDGCTNGSVVG